MTKNIDGLTDRTKDDTIAQTGPGIPDDSSSPIQASDEEIARIRSALKDGEQMDEKEELEKQLERPKHGTA
jgi:hypothetical protein